MQLNTSFFQRMAVATVALLLSATAIADNQQTNLGYYTGDASQLCLWGTQKKETYDVAIRLDRADMVGLRIDSITLPINNVHISDVSVWLSESLTLVTENNARVNHPDVMSIEISNTEQGWQTVALDNPYTITEKGVYLGMSFTITSNSDKLDRNPVVLTREENPNGLFVHTPKSYVGWTSLYGTVNGSFAIYAQVSGSRIGINAASVEPNGTAIAGVGSTYEFPFTIYNHGTTGIKSFTCRATANGIVSEQTYQLDNAISSFYDASQSFTIDMPALSEKGTYPVEIEISNVNSESNNDEEKQTTGEVEVIQTLGHKSVVMEEYTGLWCGSCPRGFVALELLNELYPDNFIAISYHNDDVMAFTNDYPISVPGFPYCSVDRDFTGDPYYGTTALAKFSMDEVVDIYAEQTPPADISLEASIDEDGMITMTSSTTYSKDQENSPYQLQYVLLADSLQGTGSDWLQTNYYTGTTNYDEYMDAFVEAPAKVEGLVFNDVAVAISAISTEEDGMPSTLKADEAYTHTYQMDSQAVLNLDGEPIIQNTSNLRAVVLLIDTTTGHIENAAQAHVSTPSGIITATIGHGDVTNVTYTDLAGRRITEPQSGIYIQTLHYADHKSVSRKIIINP